MVGDRIYASNLRGKTFVFEGTPQKFKLLAQNQLGDEAYASPVICDLKNEGVRTSTASAP